MLFIINLYFWFNGIFVERFMGFIDNKLEFDSFYVMDFGIYICMVVNKNGLNLLNVIICVFVFVKRYYGCS